MISEEEIIVFRKNRQSLINEWLDSFEMEPKILKFFEISSKWRFKVIPKFNKDEPYSDDHKTKHKQVGSIKFNIEKHRIKLKLYKNFNDGQYYTYTTDQSSNNGTYSRGRFTRLFNIDSEYYLDFNASFSPACAHLGDKVVCPVSLDEKIPVGIDAGERAGITSK